MSKYSSFKEFQLITENWRQFLKEETQQLGELGPAATAFVKNADAPLPQYVAMLKKVAADPEFQALAGAGQTDKGGPGDEALSVDEGGAAPAANLRPTQKDIGFFNSLKDQVTNPPWKPVDAVLFDSPIVMGNPPGPVLTYNGKWILDGHHRWSQVMMTNPAGNMAIANLSGPALSGPEEALKATQLAIAVQSDAVKTKPLGGPDLMQASPEQVGKYVMQNITDEVLQLLVKAGKIKAPDKKAAAQMYMQNLERIQSVMGKFDREQSMPQADHTGGKGTQGKVNQALAKGMINFKDPSPGDIKK